uniref:Si486016e08b n=1 Tax=Arundo donax TaxID=35708 RepID=A0A0A9FB78_ARUDO
MVPSDSTRQAILRLNGKTMAHSTSLFLKLRSMSLRRARFSRRP